MTIIYGILAALAVAAIYVGIRYFVRASQKFGGERVIICPETGKQAMVEVDVRHAAVSSLIGQTDLRLENCWRWPMKQDCGQECLLQIDLADHKPALLNSEGVTVEWQQIPLSAVTEAMATYQPVCWNCHIAQSFRREHADLVVDRSLPLVDRSHERHMYH